MLFGPAPKAAASTVVFSGMAIGLTKSYGAKPLFKDTTAEVVLILFNPIVTNRIE